MVTSGSVEKLPIIGRNLLPVCRAIGNYDNEYSNLVKNIVLK